MKKASDEGYIIKQKPSASDLMGFWDYLEFYPQADDPNYDGVHSGGIKGIAQDAPETAKEAFKKFQKKREEEKRNLIKC